MWITLSLKGKNKDNFNIIWLNVLIKLTDTNKISACIKVKKKYHNFHLCHTELKKQKNLKKKMSLAKNLIYIQAALW